MQDYGRQIAHAALDIGAIKLNPAEPFTWASGYRMPIYNDNRRFLFSAEHRGLIASGFEAMIDEQGINCEVVAGTSTAGISPGTTLADRLGVPFIYIRDKPKDHGLRNQIEGIDAESDLEGRKVPVIEDLISTGGSSARAVQAVRAANGVSVHCLSIFTYGLDKAESAFSELDPYCSVSSLLIYDVLLDVVKERRHLQPDQIELLREWRSDPFGWGAKHGFPKVEK